MSIENAVANRAVLLERVGKTILNTMYPKEFELYVIALELIDTDGNTLNYFIFPVNPSSLDETDVVLTNVKKTLTGIVTLKNPTFVPVDINLSGTFGRRLRILLGTDYVEFLSSFTTTPGTLKNSTVTQSSFQNGVQNTFDKRVKTGFGCLSVLKDILKAASVIDEKGPRTLIFHNLAFGTTYVVEHIQTKTSMSQETNMMHNYSLSLKAVAPLDALRGTNLEEERKRLNTTGYVQAQTDRLLQGISKIF
jgi:hypothetical protein